MTALAAIKAEARKAAFARRKDAHAAALGSQSSLLSEILAGHRGVPVAGYLPIRTEIDPLPAMAEAAAHGPVAVPVIVKAAEPLLFSRWTPGVALRDGTFGTSIPEQDDFIDPEILIVPLLAFDRHGGRLGYGGGFYDRTLQQLRARRATLAIGFGFDAQETDAIPLEPTDQPLDMIVTQSRVLSVRS